MKIPRYIKGQWIWQLTLLQEGELLSRHPSWMFSSVQPSLRDMAMELEYP